MQVKFEKPMGGGGVTLGANIFRQILLPFLIYLSSNLITQKSINFTIRNTYANFKANVY